MSEQEEQDNIKGMISEAVEIQFHIAESQRRLEEIKTVVRERAEESGDLVIVGDYDATATVGEDGEVTFTNGN